ncbi:MAG: ferredoxin reductase [Mycobacterium sp.]
MTITAPRRSRTGGLRGRIMRLAERVTTPLFPADYLDVIDPLRSGATLRGRIVAIHPETADASTLVIKPGRGWRTHTPGQYVRIGVDVDGVRQWRTYSLTSEITRPDGCICITVKAIGEGTVSNHLVHRAPIGTVVHLDQAAGEFTLDAPVTAKLLFITAGSGITPVMGMLRNMSADRHRDVVVVHCAPTAADVIFRAELRARAARGRIRLVEIHTRTDGRLDVAGIGDLVGDFTERHTWACGPAGLLADIENHWAAAGITARLRTERFQSARVVTGSGGAVNFCATGTTVESTGAESLLDIGEAAGVLMPSGCRMGICFGCVAPLRTGAVRDLRNGTITTAAPGDGVVIQTCISAAAGACEIEL